MRNYLNKLLKSLLVFFMLCGVVKVSVIDVQAANVQIQVRYGQSEARDMLTLINQFRLSTTENWQYNSSGEKITVTGLKPLVYDYDLEKYAMQRAAELALRMEHTRPNGMGTSRPNSNYSAFGENIAAGFGSYTTKESVMNGWKETNEPYSGQGHRRAMQNKNYTSVGIGHVIVNGGHYWVQIFGGPARSTTKTVANDGISIVNIDVKDSFINGLKANVNPNSMSINVNQSDSLPNVETKLSFIKDIQTFGIAPVYNPKIVWSSSNTSIATVTGNTVKGLSVGKAILTATVSYANKTTSTTVEVNVKQPVTSIQLNKTDLKINRYESETLTATVLPSNASDKSLSWSSSDTSVAKVTSTGMINARNAGTATITAKATDGSNVSVTCKVTVVIPVTSIRSSESSKEVEKGNTYTPTVTVYPENATNKKLNWSSSNSSVATVDTNGNITAKNFGDATITATSTDGSNVSKTISIHVPVLTTEIKMSPSELIIAKGTSGKFDIQVLPENSEYPNYTLKSDNENIATVSSYNNSIYGQEIGYANIIATNNRNNNIKQSARVRVVEAVSRVAIDEWNHTLFPGQTKRIIAIVEPNNAFNKKLRWTTDDSSIATVDENGVVTALNYGSTVVRAYSTDGTNRSDYARINVVKPVTSITLDKTNVTVAQGNSFTVKATALPSDANNTSVTATSSNTDVVSVGYNGSFYAKSVGTATITFTADDGSGVTKTCVVSVKPGVESITIDGDYRKTVDLEDTLQLTTTINPNDAYDKRVEWSSDDESIFTIDQNGLVKPKSVGNTYVSVRTLNNYKTDYSYISVIKKIKSIKLDKTSITVKPYADSIELKATISPVDATYQSLEWSSSNPDVAYVYNGRVYFYDEGTAIITASAPDGLGAKATCKITVRTPVESVSLNKTSLKLDVNKTETLTATIQPTNATNKAVTWSSSDTSIATVDSNGKITAKKAGTATITVKTKDGGKTATATVTVIQPVTSVSLDVTSASIKVGATKQLKATVAPSNATTKTITWTSDNTKVATVDKNGKVKAVAKGTATITAKSNNGKIATSKITVIQPVNSVSLNKTKLNLDMNKNTTLKATIKPDNANNKAVTWSSSDTRIATVDANGKITAKKTGTATITVKTKDGGKTATATVTVIQPVTGIKINASNIDVLVGNTYQAKATISPSNATTKTITWTSDNNKIATVDKNGKVTGVAKGTATITAKSNNGKIATVNITVIQPVTGISLNKDKINLFLDKSETLVATISPANANDQKVIWSSSDANIAKVDANGKVTAIKEGSVIISARSNSGGYIANCAVTVKKEPTPITNAKVSGIVNKTYTGKAQTQSIVVSLGSKTLKNNMDYSLSYQNNVNVGKATIVIKGKGEYSGQITKTFTIRSTISVTPEKANVGTMNVGKFKKTTTLKATVNSNNQKVTWSSADTSIATVDANGVVTGISDPNHIETVVDILAKTSDGQVAVSKITVEHPVAAFVRRCYRYCLSRDPEKVGFTYWSNRIINREDTAASAVRGFFESNEMKNKGLNNSQFLDICYRVMLDRKPDAQGKAYWMERMSKGMTRLQIISNFVTSNEFTKIASDYNIIRGSINR